MRDANPGGRIEDEMRRTQSKYWIKSQQWKLLFPGSGLRAMVASNGAWKP